MSADVTKDCQEIAVRAVSFPHQRGAVFCACLPCDTDAVSGHRVSHAADKIHLVSILLEHLAGIESSARTDGRFSNRVGLPIQVVHDQLGRPRLLLGEYEGPAVSFSESGGKIWAGLCPDTSDIGIDVAETDEFPPEYPFHRVFHAQELQHAVRLTSGDLKKASALLWSVKEAAVKALGCAFHLADPLQVCVRPPAEEDGGWNVSTVCLSGKALARFPIMTGRCILVRSLFQEKTWLSIAMLDRQLNRTERS